MLRWKAVVRDEKLGGQVFVIPETNVGAKSCGRVDGTATEAEKTEELHGCGTGQWGGCRVHQGGLEECVTTPSAKVLSECKEASRGS